MPIYDYLCANCRRLTEVIHGIQDAGPRFCPSCGAEGTMHKAMSAPTVHFKGSGWAKKDRTSTGSVRTKAASSSSSSDGASGDGSSSGDKTPAPAEPAKSSTEPAARTED